MKNGLSTSVRNLRNLNVFDGLALLIAFALVGIGFLVGTVGIGTVGGSEAGATTSVELTITPEDPVRPLAPGKTGTFPVYINNPNDYGVRVASISEGTSTATVSGCPDGTVYSAGVEGPTGFIRPGSIRAYEVSVTLEGTTDHRCRGQSFTLPLTVTFVSAAGDRSW